MSRALTIMRLAVQDLRGGWRGFRLFVVCLALGVAAIAAVGTVSSSLIRGLADQGQAILGGDVELRLSHREMTAEEQAWFDALASEGSFVATMRSMAHAPSTERRTLVDIKAVDAPYPLFGALELEPGGVRDLSMKGGHYGALVEEALLLRLGIKVGDQITLNTMAFDVRGQIRTEPDRIGGGMAAGPRVMISHEALAATGLVQPGTLVSYGYRYRLADKTLIEGFPEAVAAAWPQSGFRVNTSRNGAPSVKLFVERTATFLTLVGLTALLIGGVGVGNAVSSYLGAKTDMIGTLKATGADTGQVFWLFLAEVLVMSAIGIVLGLIIGGTAPLLALSELESALPVAVPLELSLSPVALGLAALYGLVTAVLFAFLPLARARDMAPAKLFRALVGGDHPPLKIADWAVLFLLFSALLAMAIAPASDPFFAMLFCVGAGFVFALLRGAGWLITWFSKIFLGGGAVVRLGIGNLHRPGAPTASTVVSLGLGLTLISAVAVIEGNIAAQIDDELPDRAPAFFLIDLQTHQIEPLKTLISKAPGAGEFEAVPAMRGRLVAIAGTPVEEVEVAPEAQWALSGDRGLTYAAAPPENSIITAGAWWAEDYAGPPLISFDAELAAGFGIGVGDTLTYNVLGRNITGTVASLRRIDWQGMGINYATVFSPGLLDKAPHTWLATLHVEGSENEAAMYRAITDTFPNITTIRVKEALTRAAELVAGMGLAVRITGAITLLAAVFVLAGAVAAGHRARVYDAVMLKVLGASRRQILTAYFIEYAVLGLATAAIAAVLGSAVGYIIVTEMMEANYRLLPLTLFAVLAFGLAFTLSIGLIGTWNALRARPAHVLRTL